MAFNFLFHTFKLNFLVVNYNFYDNRFVYGKDVTVKSLLLGIEIYQFANQWQIKHLDEIAASSCFIFDMEPIEICHLYETFKLLDNKLRTSQALKVNHK